MANDILQPHSDETVSKNIADHKRPLQTSVMSNGKWYNIGNTLLQMNDREDLHKVSKIVQQHQADITNAEKTANDAHSEAQKAIDNSTVASNAASEVSAAVSDAKSTASGAQSTATVAQSDASAALSTASGTLKSAQTAIDSANSNASTALKNASSALSTASAASDAASSNALEISKTSSAIALKADSSAVDVVKSQVANVSTLASQNANELSTKANESDVDALKRTVDTHTTEIDQNSKQITLKANSSDVDEVKKTVTSQAAEISATSSEVATKASQTTVDSLSEAVSQNTASIKTNADNITSKVTRDDVSGMLKDGSYATEKYVQTTAKQTADSFNQSVVDLNGKITNVNQSLDGLRTNVKGKADQSALTQLSGVVDSKVSSKDFETERTQLSNAINDRVSKGDVISQINQEAGGNTLIQVANGKGELLLDADSTVFSGKAFIPSAAIGSVTADQVKTGKLVGDNLGIDLNTGEVEFAKGKIHSLDDTFKLDITNGRINLNSQSHGYMAQLNANDGLIFYKKDTTNLVGQVFEKIDSDRNSNLIASSENYVLKDALAVIYDHAMSNRKYVLSISDNNFGPFQVAFVPEGKSINDNQKIVGSVSTSSPSLSFVVDTNTEIAGSIVLISDGNTVNSGLINHTDSVTHEVTVTGTFTPITLRKIFLGEATDHIINNINYNFGTFWEPNPADDDANSIFDLSGNNVDIESPEGAVQLRIDTTQNQFMYPQMELSVDSFQSGDATGGIAKINLSPNGVKLSTTDVESKEENGNIIAKQITESVLMSNNNGYINFDLSAPMRLTNSLYVSGAGDTNDSRYIGAPRIAVTDDKETYGNFRLEKNYVAYENAADTKGFWIKGTDLWVDGTVYGKAWSQTSVLSAKTNINKLNQQHALDVINATDIYDYQYKSDVEKNVNKHYASLVIDDIHNTPEYRTPKEFIGDKGTGRDDGTQLAYLTAAVQLIDQRLKKLEDK